jgi:ATP-binding cassette, subfamily B, multidrug efflux pump
MEPDKISSYFKSEIRILTTVTISGLIYNIGLLAGPYFQGKLIDAVAQQKEMHQVLITALLFIAAITIVQTGRAIKRFAVRRFANDINAKMQNIIYTHIVNETEDHLINENVGSLMTKAVSDVDVCVEGMRKFTTELFDTVVFLISYFITLLIYDWKLTALSCAFIPLALFIAGRLRKIITGYTATWRKSMSDITNSSYDLINNAVLYRIYGREKDNYENYRKQNAVYEKKAVLANIWENSMMPLYKCISLVGVIAIIAAGSDKVVNGIWTIGKFTAYVTMFIALAEKASHAGKLFNAVQKAQVSWKRIKPFLTAGKINTIKTDTGFTETNKDNAPATNFPTVFADHISFTWNNDISCFTGVSFELQRGQILGITGPVACGKSTLAQLFLGGRYYTGSLKIQGTELSSLSDNERISMISYMGHESSLISATIYDNITLGDDGDITPVLSAVCFDIDLLSMENGIQTLVGNGGIRLSGGQQERIALARTLWHKKPLMILDDPFASIDQATEQQIMKNIRTYCADSAVMLLSHRLSLFSTLNNILLLDGNGSYMYGLHDDLLESSPLYRKLYNLQKTSEVEK